jgi:hypothetical protein
MSYFEAIADDTDFFSVDICTDASKVMIEKTSEILAKKIIHQTALADTAIHMKKINQFFLNSLFVKAV